MPTADRIALTPENHQGLPALHTAGPAGIATLYLHGATLTHVQPADQPHPLLYLSPDAVLDGGKPLRGGVPVCFPWFGPNAADPDAPAHGLVRNKPWELVEASTQQQPGRDQDAFFDATLRTRTDHFEATYRVLAAADHTRLSFTAKNTTDQPQPFELALHTYFVISDIHHVSVTGLEHTAYLDNLNDRARANQDAQPVTFTGEFDRVYVDTKQDITLHDPGLKRNIRVTTTDAPSAVVWNPWTEKSKRLADLPDDAWPNFLCIESGLIADDAVALEPGQEHTATVTIQFQ